MAVKIILFQANSNLIRHLQFESCMIGKLPVQRKERKQNTHKYRVRTDLEKSLKMTLVLENSLNSKKVQFVHEF